MTFSLVLVTLTSDSLVRASSSLVFRLEGRAETYTLELPSVDRANSKIETTVLYLHTSSTTHSQSFFVRAIKFT